MKKLQIFGLIGILLILSGCTTFAYRKPLDVASQKKVYFEQLLIDANQEKLLPEAKHPQQTDDVLMNSLNSPAERASPVVSSIGKGTAILISALIVTEINNHQIQQAERDMLPISNELQNFSLIGYFTNQLNRELKETKKIKIGTTTLKYGLTLPDAVKIANLAKENTTLLVITDYQLNNDLSAFMMSADVKIYQKNIQDIYGDSPLYQNRFTFIYYLPIRSADRRQKAQFWAKDDGQLIKQVLQEAANSIARWIVIDILNPNSNLYARSVNNSINFFNEYHQKLTGKVLMAYKEFYVVRVSDDTIYILNTQALKD